MNIDCDKLKMRPIPSDYNRIELHDDKRLIARVIVCPTGWGDSSTTGNLGEIRDRIVQQWNEATK